MELFCSTFECIKLYCVPASIVPDVAMSGAARVNEPFPGPLAAEYYIDNRNCLPSVRDTEDVPPRDVVTKTLPLESIPVPIVFFDLFLRNRCDPVTRSRKLIRLSRGGSYDICQRTKGRGGSRVLASSQSDKKVPGILDKAEKRRLSSDWPRRKSATLSTRFLGCRRISRVGVWNVKRVLA